MSVAFTTPTGTTLQLLSFYNELQLAYSERVQALGGLAQTAFSDGAYWQKLSMYQGWQNWLETECFHFVDSSTGNVQFNPAGTDFLYFTKATWRAAAGLNANGFSRYDKDGNFIAYGIAQDNDLICDKLFLELQAGFGALQWCRGGVIWSQSFNSRVLAESRLGLDAAQAEADAVWPNNGGAVGVWPRAWSYCYYISYELKWYASLNRITATPTLSCAIVIPHIFSFYITCGTYGTDGIFYNNNDAVTESSTYYLQDTSEETTSLTWGGTTIGSTDKPAWGDPYYTYGYSINSAGLVLVKYNFTNS